MKIGLYASMFGQDKPPTLESIESYIDYAYELRLDLIDFRRDRGFDSKDPCYLFETKLNCLRRGVIHRLSGLYWTFFGLGRGIGREGRSR